MSKTGLIASRAGCGACRLNKPPWPAGALSPPSSPYTTRAAIRPDRRLQTSHPAGSAYVSGGRRRKTLLRTPDIAKRVEPPEACTQIPDEDFASDRAWRSQAASKLLRSYLPPEQHEADGCRLPASSTGPKRAKRRRAAAGLAVSSPKPAAKKWALRPPSRAQRRQRRPHGRALLPMGDASRSELANPALRGPNAKRAPGRPVCP